MSEINLNITKSTEASHCHLEGLPRNIVLLPEGKQAINLKAVVLASDTGDMNSGVETPSTLFAPPPPTCPCTPDEAAEIIDRVSDQINTSRDFWSAHQGDMAQQDLGTLMVLNYWSTIKACGQMANTRSDDILKIVEAQKETIKKRTDARIKELEKSFEAMKAAEKAKMVMPLVDGLLSLGSFLVGVCKGPAGGADILSSLAGFVKVGLEVRDLCNGTNHEKEIFALGMVELGFGLLGGFAEIRNSIRAGLAAKAVVRETTEKALSGVAKEMGEGFARAGSRALDEGTACITRQVMELQGVGQSFLEACGTATRGSGKLADNLAIQLAKDIAKESTPALKQNLSGFGKRFASRITEETVNKSVLNALKEAIKEGAEKSESELVKLICEKVGANISRDVFNDPVKSAIMMAKTTIPSGAGKITNNALQINVTNLTGEAGKLQIQDSRYSFKEQELAENIDTLHESIGEMTNQITKFMNDMQNTIAQSNDLRSKIANGFLASRMV